MLDLWFIAQSSGDTDRFDVVVQLGYIAAASVLIAVVFWLLRRWLARHDDDQPIATGFTLADLRRLHREGELTDEQFAAAKSALIARGLASMGGLDETDDESPDADPAAPARLSGDAPDDQPNADGLSDGTLNPDDDRSSDKSGGGSGGDDAPPKRDK